jgi:hypothetical protein
VTEWLSANGNAGFMVAAYGVTGLILAGYALSLWRAARKRAAVKGKGSGDRT